MSPMFIKCSELTITVTAGEPGGCQGRGKLTTAEQE